MSWPLTSPLVVPAALMLLVASTAAHAQRVTITARGPGQGGRFLEEVIAAPHRLVEPDSAWFVLGRAERSRTLLILGRTAAIGGLVDGNVVVVGGDLHIRPGAYIGGRAVAIGGGVYVSARAIVFGGTRTFRDDTYDITRDSGGYRLAYRPLRARRPVSASLPGIYGIRAPSYDRVNGASLPIGPAFQFLGGRGEANLLATYRSDLGKLDPSVDAELQLSTRTRIEAAVGRGTFTNDSWIRSNFVNSLSTFVGGNDTRNYFRADRADLTLHHLFEAGRLQIEPFVGGRAEDAWSVGPEPGEPGSPWSIFGRTDADQMRRPNPPIIEGRIGSVLAGTAVQWEAPDLRVRLRARGEQSVEAPGDVQFTQVTSDLGISFPTFGLQEYAIEVHSVTTFGDTVPPQRFAYLGGPGTLAFLDMLEQGGDELLFVEQYYLVPVSRLRLGFFGVPNLFLRHRLGSAGIGGLPEFEQTLGLGLSLTLLRFEIDFDPANGDVRFGGGVSFSR